ncbi:hypothetical protein C3943_19070 [Lysinibacillus sp. B2A1]|nr:hypothetical protein C3943_03140 [Lysinibacillus sp. B2A1]AVK85475.1 hypothetical protein C3943_19070 [Lysinibacillus sp. B2A1]
MGERRAASCADAPCRVSSVSLSHGSRVAHSCQLKKCVLLLKSGIDIYKTFFGRGAFDVDTETYTITPKAI